MNNGDLGSKSIAGAFRAIPGTVIGITDPDDNTPALPKEVPAAGPF